MRCWADVVFFLFASSPKGSHQAFRIALVPKLSSLRVFHTIPPRILLKVEGMDLRAFPSKLSVSPL